MHLDSLDSVRQGAAEFKARCGGKLNILINIAGMIASQYGKTEDGFELMVGINHFAHFLLFQPLKPLLLQSAEETGATTRVVNVSSEGHSFGGIKFDDINWHKGAAACRKWAACGQSKTANIHMATSITRHYVAQNLRRLSVHRGGIATELTRNLIGFSLTVGDRGRLCIITCLLHSVFVSQS